MELPDSQSVYPNRGTTVPPAVIPYPAIEEHGLIGDRRTAALVASDGTIDWLCLPDYDGAVVFGALLDWSKGGYWRVGPACRVQGEQSYLKDTWVLQTEWALETGTLLLSDAMLRPETTRPTGHENVRALLRHLVCTSGQVRARFDLRPAINFTPSSTTFTRCSSGFFLDTPDFRLSLWANAALKFDSSCLSTELHLREGEELWTVLESGAVGQDWTVETMRSELDQTEQYWRSWLHKLGSETRDEVIIRRTALAIHLLTYAPQGSVVAAPTTSLPERIGGTWNVDYRLCWLRDTSLALAILSRLGDWEETELYLRWLTKRQSRSRRPFQVLYELRGGKRPRQREFTDLQGYRGSRPIRFGNHAYKQRQFGSLGFLADCVWTYLQEGGPWRNDYWQLIRRCANYIAKNWTQPDNGIWELAKRKHYVHSKVLCWVMLDRAVKIAREIASSYDVSHWQCECSRIHEEVMAKGWSESLSSFRQSYDAENLDAAELLISVMEFLPGDHPRVLATIDRIAESLTIDGYVYRFDPLKTGVGTLPLGEFEAAFLPCNFWLATAYAKAGRLDMAQGILTRAEQLTGKPALFSEAVDPRTGAFRGNTPLLFSHAENVRAKLAIAEAGSNPASGADQRQATAAAL